jgi:hypothetical protein
MHLDEENFALGVRIYPSGCILWVSAVLEGMASHPTCAGTLKKPILNQTPLYEVTGGTSQILQTRL